MGRLIAIGARYFLVALGIWKAPEMVDAVTPDEVNIEMDKEASNGLFLFLALLGGGIFLLVWWLIKKRKK
jgi:hypothetical protein